MNTYSLSFSEEFFVDGDPYDYRPSDRPTSVLQAIDSLDEGTKIAISRDVLGMVDPVNAVVTDDFAWAVLDKVRETDTCSGLTPPVRVWIDSDGYYTVDVWEKEGE